MRLVARAEDASIVSRARVARCFVNGRGRSREKARGCKKAKKKQARRKLCT